MDWVLLVVGLLVGGSSGFFAALYMISRDARIIALKEDELIVKRDLFERMVEIVKVRSGDLQFDAQGYLKKDLAAEGDDE